MGEPIVSSQSQRNRELILEAALTEVAERGYAAATMRSVARRAQVDPRLVRYYFPSKKDLVAEALAAPDLAGMLAGTEGRPRMDLPALWAEKPTEWRAVVAGALSGEPDLQRPFIEIADVLVSGGGRIRESDKLDAALAFSRLVGIWTLTTLEAQAEHDPQLRSTLLRCVEHLGLFRSRTAAAPRIDGSTPRSAPTSALSI